jgi:hypothetical protein
MASLVYLTVRAPAALTDNLIAAGHQVWEALAISEVLALCTQHDIDAVIVAADVKDRGSKVAELTRICVLLDKTAKTSEVLWQIEQLFPSNRGLIQ